MAPRALLPALLLLAAPALRAQTVSLWAGGGFERAAYDTVDLDVFTDTYNTYYAQRLDAPYDFVDPTLSHPFFGGTIRIDAGTLVAAFGYQYGRKGQTRAADLGAIEQAFDLTVTDHTVVTELGLDLGAGLYLAGVVSGVFRSVALDHRTTYADGSTSIGNELVPNGHFTGVNPHLDAGVGVGLRLGRIAVPVRVTVPVMTFEGNPLTDFDLQLRSYFPADWERYLEDNANVDDGNAVREDAFGGLRVTVGVELRILPL